MNAPLAALVPDLSRAQAALFVCTLGIGLPADIRTDIVGQTLVGLACWAVMLGVIGRYPRDVRWIMLACLSLATAGELFLSLVWGLYTYRLENIPLFVPPGHVMMLLLGLALARRMPPGVAAAILAAAGLYTAGAALAGLDTLGVALFLVVLLAWLALPQQRRLFAGTLVLALALELYGTWIGNWFWAREVPGMALVTTNPPGASGAFYAALDALVACALAAVAPRRARRMAETQWTRQSSRS